MRVGASRAARTLVARSRQQQRACLTSALSQWIPVTIHTRIRRNSNRATESTLAHTSTCSARMALETQNTRTLTWMAHVPEGTNGTRGGRPRAMRLVSLESLLNLGTSKTDTCASE